MLSAEAIAGRASNTTRWRRFLHGRHAPALTHGSLILLTVALFVLLIRLPFWMAFVPCAIIQHRMGILLHEYIHGIPFARYRTNLRVLSFFDGVMLMFGLTELFRGTHLAHHRWLNTERDPAVDAARRNAPAGWRKVTALEGVQHLIYLVDALRGHHRYVIPSRIGSGMGLSLTWVGFWILVGEHGMPLKLAALTIYNTLIPISFRGAVEHHSHPGDPAFANEYRVVIPLFGLNKHIHHHLAPRCPWYLLEYRTERPLWTFHYFTHWFHAYVARDYVLMRPVPDPRALHRPPRARGIDGPPGQHPAA